MSELLTKITGTISSDIASLLVVFIILFLCTMYFGKNRMISFILAFYPSMFLYNIFPFMDKVILLKGQYGILINEMVIFLIILVLVSLVIKKHFSSYDDSAGLMRNAGAAIAVLILILLFSYTTINLDLFHDFSPSIDALFTGEVRIFWWSLASLIILGVI